MYDKRLRQFMFTMEDQAHHPAASLRLVVALMQGHRPRSSERCCIASAVFVDT